MQKHPKNQSGVVILYALLMIALITAIGIGVSVIIIRELRLTQNTHYATLAYYAADSGVERALYTVKVSRDEGDLSQTITKIRNYNADQNGFVNNASYSDIQTSAEEERIETNLEKDQITQFDLYDIQNPTGPSNINSLKISWSDGTPSNGSSPWLEISYIKWDPASPYIDTEVQSSYKLIYSTADLVDGSLPVIFQDRTSAYRVRLKALYDTISNLVVTAYDCPDPLSQSCTDNEKKNIPARVIVKSVGKMGEFEQAITALVPWNIPLFGLYDYVLYSEGQIEKKIIVGAPIYTSGAIQVENALTSTNDCPSGCPKYGTCMDWKAVCCAQNASCTFDGSNNGTCAIKNTNSTHWVLPTPDYVQPAEKYYLSFRANYTGLVSGRNMQLILGETCKNIPDQLANNEGWVSCSIPDDDFTITPNINIMFKQDVTSGGAVNVDWYQLSTYKIFNDCSGISDCTIPTPLCGDCICQSGDGDCPADAIDCSADVCKNPVCSDGCGEVNMADNSTDPGECDSPDICCGGACTVLDPPLCDNHNECADADACTTDTCENLGTCTSYCDHVAKSAPGDCSMTSDGCCPTGCIDTNDIDCESVPDYEYLRYIAIDENNTDLTSLPPSGLPGKSQRSIPAWQGQNSGTANYLRDVFALSNSDVWAVAENNIDNNNIIFTSDGGQTWNLATVQGIATNLKGIWASSTNNVIAVGNGGIIKRCTSSCNAAGATFNDEASGTANDLIDIYGLDSSKIWAVGANGTILYYDGFSWSDKSSGASNYYGVWAYDTDNVWVVGDNGTILNCSGTCANPTWNPQTSNSTYILTAISGTYTTNFNIWISARSSLFGSTAGETILYSSDGTNWIKQNNNSDAHMYGISAYKEPNNEARAIVTGLGGNTFYYDGSSWSSQITGSAEVNRAVYAYNWQNIWVTGETGVILYANAPSNGIATIGNGYEQYWLSKQYSSFDPLDGNYQATLNITRLPLNKQPVTIIMSIGYCDGGCDQSSDFHLPGWLTSLAQNISDKSSQFYSFTIGSGDFTCTNCRFWTRLQATSASGGSFDMSVSGREAAHSVDSEKDSYIDIP